MNAKEYRAYCDEQEQKQNRQSVQENATRSDIYIAPNMIRPKTKENPSRGLIRATLKGYRELNTEIERLRESIHNYNAIVCVTCYGETPCQHSNKRDISDVLVNLENKKYKMARLVFISRLLENALYGLRGLRAEYIIYIIEVYLRGKKEPERRKVARIIDTILEKGVTLPMIERAQIVINENGKE